jgi:bifunctional non-homologous end joining protein LigD
VRAGWRRGLSIDALHRHGTVSNAILYAFDILEHDASRRPQEAAGEAARQATDRHRLVRLVGKRRIGIVLSEHTDEDGAAVFQHGCKIGLEGIVSKRLSAPYRRRAPQTRRARRRMR